MQLTSGRSMLWKKKHKLCSYSLEPCVEVYIAQTSTEMKCSSLKFSLSLTSYFPSLKLSHPCCGINVGSVFSCCWFYMYYTRLQTNSLHCHVFKLFSKTFRRKSLMKASWTWKFRRNWIPTCPSHFTKISDARRLLSDTPKIQNINTRRTN